MTAIAKDDLPFMAHELIRLVGWDAAICLIQRIGSQRWPVPMGPDNNDAGRDRFAVLQECCGYDGAMAIVAEFGGDWLDVPKCSLAMARARAREVRARRQAGAKIEELVRDCNLSRRRVFEILASDEPLIDERQIDMFSS